MKTCIGAFFVLFIANVIFALVLVVTTEFMRLPDSTSLIASLGFAGLFLAYIGYIWWSRKQKLKGIRELNWNTTKNTAVNNVSTFNKDSAVDNIIHQARKGDKGAIEDLFKVGSTFNVGDTRQEKIAPAIAEIFLSDETDSSTRKLIWSLRKTKIYPIFVSAYPTHSTDSNDMMLQEQE